MATFITLTKFTDQGIRNIKESPDRFVAFQAMAEKMGLQVKGAFYTIGEYDLMVIIEGDEQTATAALLKIASLGNVHTQTLRAFSPDEMKAIIAKMP